MKKIFIFQFTIALFLLVACKEKKEAEVTVTQEGSFVCPMKCEGEKVYSVAGKCPVCNMDLVPVQEVGGVSLYTMDLTTVPATIDAKKPVKLVFVPKLKSDPNAQVPLDEVHEKKLHVIVVSSDLGWYDHIHPDYQADGSYTVEETFPEGGEYIVFADFQPSGAGNHVERKTIAVNGMSSIREPFKSEVLTTETDGYTVKLIPSEGKFVTNNMIHLGVEVMDKNTPVTAFENIMGAKGHLVIISADGQKYLHVHPDEVDGKLDLHTQFDQAGIYRAFFQFQTNGKLHTSYFTLDVKEGKPGDLKGDADHNHTPKHGEEGHDHEHDHGQGEHEH